MLHPDFVTIPGIGWTIRSYGFAIGMGFLLALWIAVRRARRVGRDPATITTIALIGMALGIVGCRGMHIIHHYRSALLAGEVSLKELVLAAGGGEILGGVVLAVVGVIGYLFIVRKPVLAYLDIMFPPMFLAMGIGRLGCLAFGCCWGGVCMTDAGDKGLPWAIRFPYGSPAQVRDVTEGRIELPDELMWRLPDRDERSPIPREVLFGYDIDADTELLDWSEKNAALEEASHADPDGAEATRLRKELGALKKQLSTRPTGELFSQLTAARHLAELNRREGHAKVTWADLRRIAETQRSRWVHPAQLYDAGALALLFILLTVIFNRNMPAGTVVAWGMILYPINRILQEIIRSDNPHDTFGLTISQFISLAVLLAGVGLAVWVARRTPAVDDA